jgi:hypothetical protein
MNFIKKTLNGKSLVNSSKYAFFKNSLNSKFLFSTHHKWGTDLKADVESFKKHSKITIDYIVEKQKKIDSLPITSKNKPGYLDELIPSIAPEVGKDFSEVL